ncbi:peptide-N4-asparagine amidase [Streptomyces sp. NPDC048442]|uniref:peptide-N4-asparagine amidase n=1 Tax=Streptomyces sp. NPDC048442 TaxID=3154823 RepID=UPI003433F2D6
MRQRRVISMVSGLVLAAGALFGASPAGAAVTNGPTPPAEFGNDWHDPLTAGPPVAKPHTRSCQVTLGEAQFRDFTPYKGSYTPPKKCGDRWSKVVLRLDGKVKGRQYDRLGYLHVGGVEVLKTSTPEPSVDGITWSVEKDVTRYSDTFRRDQSVEMLIGNVVNETYTGVIDVKATLTFYAAEGRTKPAETPDRVLTLGGPDANSLTTPRNSQRILAEVYATGSGGGCEEYWYLSVPENAPYSCKAAAGPYREVQIKVDGKLAGIAAPFPTVWTGGWSNPFLWYVVPGPRAFDIKPIQYDLTPFAGLLNDGRPHKVEVGVVGVPEGQSGWNTPVNVLVWQDHGSRVVTGALTRHAEGTPVNSTKYTPGSEHRLDTRGGHRLTVAGYVNTSRGRVDTRIARSLANTSVHRWTEGEKLDALKGEWTDEETVAVKSTSVKGTVGPERATQALRTYTMDGTTTVGPDPDARLRTVLTLGDKADTETLVDGRRTAFSQLDDVYKGDAAYHSNAPREQRHAVGTTGERYRLYDSDGTCYDRSVTSVQGTLVEDRRHC